MSSVNYLNFSPRMEQLRLIKTPSSTTLRNPSGCSMLSHSLNRVWLVRATPSPKFLASLGTSDISKTLDENMPVIDIIDKNREWENAKI